MIATTSTHGTAIGNDRSRIRNAFTLIELLVVIAIIAILVGMGAYVYPQAIDQAKKTRTKALISDVVNASKAYQLEYNRLPVNPSADESTEIVFDEGGDGSQILAILTGVNGPLGARSNANPREITFFEPDISKGVSIGIVYEGNSPIKLLDAWGQPLKIVMDSNYDRKIPNPQDGASPTDIRKQVIVWSDGSPSQEKENEWVNNVKSWE